MPPLSKKIKYVLLDEIGFPGYRVGNDGSIWSRWIITPLPVGNGTFSSMSDTWKNIKGRVDKDGYIGLSLKHSDGKRRCRKAHRIILEAFIGPCPEGMECRHLDGNPSNNRLSNLKWGTHLENQADKQLHGTSNKGERHGNSILTEPQVREMKQLFSCGKYSVSGLSRKFGVSHGCVRDIVKGKNWPHVII